MHVHLTRVLRHCWKSNYPKVNWGLRVNPEKKVSKQSRKWYTTFS